MRIFYDISEKKAMRSIVTNRAGGHRKCAAAVDINPAAME
jgi:hypothetical protein